LGGVGRFELSVAAYPEGHPESGSVEADLGELESARSMPAPAARSRSSSSIRMSSCAIATAARPPASMPPSCPGYPADHAIFRRCCVFAGRCGASVPAWLRQRFDGLDDDPETRRMIAANVAIEQVQRLRSMAWMSFTSIPESGRTHLRHLPCLGAAAAGRASPGGLMHTPPQSARGREFMALLRERLVILDGAMGTMIQRHALNEQDFRGERFAGLAERSARQQRSFVRSRSRIIAGIHREYLMAGADVISTNTFNSTAVSQADYGMQSLVGRAESRGRAPGAAGRR
jgi:hypothetical protein